MGKYLRVRNGSSQKGPATTISFRRKASSCLTGKGRKNKIKQGVPARQSVAHETELDRQEKQKEKRGLLCCGSPTRGRKGKIFGRWVDFIF